MKVEINGEEEGIAHTHDHHDHEESHEHSHCVEPVSYTHLDVYKRQEHSTTYGIQCPLRTEIRTYGDA